MRFVPYVIRLLYLLGFALAVVIQYSSINSSFSSSPHAAVAIFKNRFLQGNGRTGLILLIAHSDNNPTFRALERKARTLDMVTGPLVNRIVITSASAFRNYCNSHEISLSIGINNVAGNETIAAFNVFDDPWKFHTLPFPSAHSSRVLIESFQKMFKLSVRFVLPRANTESFELRWVHFRGNCQILPLGRNNEPLIIHPGEYIDQTTFSGHLFAIMRVNRSNSCYAERSIETQIQLDRIASLVMIPAVHLPGKTVVITLTDDLIENGTALELLQEQSLLSEHRHEPHPIKRMLLHYWQAQRQSQIMPSVWHLPSIGSNIAMSSGDLSSRRLWKVIELPMSLTEALSSSYYYQKYLQSGASEGSISLVFNQYEAPTFHYPLPHGLMRELEHWVLEAMAQWIGYKQESLQITGSYGVREYRSGAILRWHVDPTEYQPLTAIIHIGHYADEQWSLQVPRELDRESPDELFLPDNIEEVVLEVGQVLLLQTAKVPHARLEPYRGRYFGNAYVHIAPNDWATLEEVRNLSC